MTVGGSAVAAHLDHGDYKGECAAVTTATVTTSSSSKKSIGGAVLSSVRTQEETGEDAIVGQFFSDLSTALEVPEDRFSLNSFKETETQYVFNFDITPGAEYENAPSSEEIYANLVAQSKDENSALYQGEITSHVLIVEESERVRPAAHNSDSSNSSPATLAVALGVSAAIIVFFAILLFAFRRFRRTPKIVSHSQEQHGLMGENQKDTIPPAKVFAGEHIEVTTQGSPSSGSLPSAAAGLADAAAAVAEPPTPREKVWVFNRAQ